MIKEEILKTTKDELINFLIENDTYIIPKLPTGREKEFFNANDFHTTERLCDYV